ncbi:MAG TPA: hypothetical protein VII82_12310, partial [Polyangiaceae bacterium]
MSGPPCAEKGPKSAQQARFDALRDRVFQEMSKGSARWRLTWILPFHVLTVGFLVARGESATRAIIQGLCVLGTGIVFVVRARWQSQKLSTASFVFWIVSYFTLCATSGGLASPFIVMLGLMICVASMTMQRPAWVRPLTMGLVVTGFAALALLSHTAVGQLAGPLASTAAGPSPDLIVVTLMTVALTILGVAHMGGNITNGYERAALELASRREELCSENEDRTRALEG